MNILSKIPLKYKAMAAAAVISLVFVAGYIKGCVDTTLQKSKDQTVAQTERAENAESQRDIANAAPASVDDMLEWLHRGGGPK